MHDPANIPERIFTYAFSGPSRYRRRGRALSTVQNLYFLFKGTFTAAEGRELLQREEFDGFFLKERFGIQYESYYAVTDDTFVMNAGFTEGLNQRVPAVIDGEYQVLYPRRIQESCTLPHKYILGCSECLSETENPELHCRIKKMFLNLRDRSVSSGILDTLDGWKHLKVRIGDYAFVSPSYVGNNGPFSPRKIPREEVQFDKIVPNIEARKNAAQKKAQGDRFKKSECSRCLVQRVCATGKHRWCSGSYDKTEEEYYAHILENSIVPFTNTQIRYLLLNSGKLREQHNKKECYLTFRYRDGLTFVLGNMKSGEELPLSFKAATKIIKTYGDDNNGKLRITKRLKALLVAASTFKYSPVQSSGWHTTNYPSRYLLYSREGFRQFFYYKRPAGIAHWTLHTTCLADIFCAHNTLPFMSRSNSPLTLIDPKVYGFHTRSY